MWFRVFALLVCGSLLASGTNAGVIFTTSYTAAEGFSNAPLSNNADWVGGPNVAVRPGTTGFVRNGQVPSDLPTFNIHSALGTSGASAFRVGDQIKINTYIQFDLPPSIPFQLTPAQEIARFGFSGSTSSAVLEHGFGVVWDESENLNDLGNSGSLRFFPDFNDYVYVNDSILVNENNSLSITGRSAGLDVDALIGGTFDVRSNMFDVSYTAEKLSADEWGVVDLSILNLSRTMNNFFRYDLSSKPFQTFSFNGPDAFFGQQLIVRGQRSEDAIARSEYVTYSFIPANPVPEPSSILIAALISAFGCIPRRHRG
tara:strand:- start:429401 stop:430342 length:942 start_codon:yes stop_codon:yes gene_type:complete